MEGREGDGGKVLFVTPIREGLKQCGFGFFFLIAAYIILVNQMNYCFKMPTSTATKNSSSCTKNSPSLPHPLAPSPSLAIPAL